MEYAKDYPSLYCLSGNLALKNNNHCFTAGEHGQSFKTRFSEQPVDYYGEKMLYSEYLKNILQLDELHIKGLTQNINI